MIPERIKERIAAHRRGEVNWDLKQRAYWDHVPEPLRDALCDIAAVPRSLPVHEYTDPQRAALYRAASMAHQHGTKVAMGTFANTFTLAV